MRKLILLAVVLTSWLFTTKSIANTHRLKDSVKTVHTLDGNINEWNIGKFDSDPITKTLYSADNDGENLYVAMKIADQAIQYKIMSQGMSMFIDKKGKKRENATVQFPIKKAVDGFSGRGGGGGPRLQGGQQYSKEMRELFTARLLFLKVFSMENLDDDKTMVISQPGLVNIAYSWDDENNMYIEYRVPLIFIAEPVSLNGKAISIGWKLHGGELPKAVAEADSKTVTTTTQIVGVPAGTTPSSSSSSRGGRGGGGGRSGAIVNYGSFPEPEVKEHSMWTKYVVAF
ncbi:MAG: hypothetical protein ABIS69_11250 [Sediminibacterium sp.]